MKRQYNKPLIKVVVIVPMRTYLNSASLITADGLGTVFVDSRQSNAFEDDEDEEIEDSMWK